jgi:hypothetical protein
MKINDVIQSATIENFQDVVSTIIDMQGLQVAIKEKVTTSTKNLFKKCRFVVDTMSELKDVEIHANFKTMNKDDLVRVISDAQYHKFHLEELAANCYLLTAKYKTEDELKQDLLKANKDIVKLVAKWESNLKIMIKNFKRLIKRSNKDNERSIALKIEQAQLLLADTQYTITKIPKQSK